MTSVHFDAAVIGAGPAGSATARRLAMQGQRVALVERSRFESPRVGESLAPAVQPLLFELGVWREFLSLNPLPSNGTRSQWGDATPRVHSHLMSPWGCGWHVDRRRFDLMLARAACAAGATPYFGMTLTSCAETTSEWQLELRQTADSHRTGRTLQLRARVVIDATGRAARLATRLSARRFMLDHLVSVTTQFEGVDVTQEGYVMIESTTDGWWYTAPVPASSIMAMLMTDSDLCRRSRLVSVQAWSARLEAADSTRRRVAAGRPLWGPRIFCASSHRLRRSERTAYWLAVGDAALAVDPISGNGVIRALRTAQAASQTVLALSRPNSRDAIEAYEEEGDAQCTAYLEERALYYGMEQRWGGYDFWMRRRTTPVL
jgi:flavin-dependent dehydrogenase